MIFLFKALSFWISVTFVFNVLIHTALSQRQSAGPMSELTGTTAAVDKILSPGNSVEKTGSTSSPRIFLVGNGIQTPTPEAIIPPSPLLTGTGNFENPSFLPVVFPFNHQQNAVLAASGRSNRIFTATFQLPGRSLVVFPIGLVVYAVLSLITLMMVILVTFERIQYRNQFRSRKKNQVTLAPGEKMAPLGFVGSPV